MHWRKHCQVLQFHRHWNTAAILNFGSKSRSSTTKITTASVWMGLGWSARLLRLIACTLLMYKYYVCFLYVIQDSSNNSFLAFLLELWAQQLPWNHTIDSGSLLVTNKQSPKIVTNLLQLKYPRSTSRFNFIFHLLGKIIQLHNRSFHCFTDEMQMNLAPRSARATGLSCCCWITLWT